MFSYPFRMVSATATVLIIVEDDCPARSKFLVGTRSDTAQVFPNRGCLPGGFTEAKLAGVHAGESVEDTAVREVFEETGIVISKEDLVLFHQTSHPDTDPRAHVVNLCFLVVVTPEQAATAKAGDDLKAIDWVRVNTDVDDLNLAFNHVDITKRGLKLWKALAYSSFVRDAIYG